MARPTIIRHPPPEEEEGLYFTSEKKHFKFIHSGCLLLDLVLGGGWVCGRVANVIGDKSTGKTLLVMEAIANFLLAYPDAPVRYTEAEAAFDEQYAEALGIPIHKIEFKNDIDTVEELFKDLESFIASVPTSQPALYILDTLDALSDAAEMDREIGEGSYNVAKPKLLSQLFRRLVRKLKRTEVAVIIVSQTRDAIGVTFGSKVAISGGKALEFYASQRLMLSHLKTLKRSVGKVDRPTGILVKAKAIKNKIGLPLRECEFEITFGYGIDDLKAGRDWLKEIGEPLNVKGDLREHRKLIEEQVRRHWNKIETTLLPKVRKYEG